MEQQLRAFLTKLAMAASLLAPLPPDCTFRLLVATRDAEATANGFVVADPGMDSIANSTLHPIKAASLASIIDMQLFVEESPAKALPHAAAAAWTQPGRTQESASGSKSANHSQGRSLPTSLATQRSSQGTQ